MQYDILLTKNPGNGYTARPMLWPEMVVSGEDEEAVLACVQERLAEILHNSRIVSVNVSTLSTSVVTNPINEKVEHPLKRFAGMFANVPDEEWNRFQATIAAVRQEMNQIPESELA